MSGSHGIEQCGTVKVFNNKKHPSRVSLKCEKKNHRGKPERKVIRRIPAGERSQVESCHAAEIYPIGFDESMESVRKQSLVSS